MGELGAEFARAGVTPNNCLALMLRFVPLFSLVLLTACGARSGVSKPDIPDAGTPTDAGPPPGLEVECGRRAQFTTSFLPLTLLTEARAGATGLRHEWSVSPNAGITLRENGGPAATVTPDDTGTWIVTDIVSDDEGNSVTCEYEVQSIVGPPVAICPEGQPLFVDAGDVLDVEGDSFDDVAVVSHRWTIASVPPGGSPRLSPLDTPQTTFQASEGGEYVITLTVEDETTASDSCDVRIIVGGPPEVTCPEGPIMTPTRRPLDLVASARDDRGLASTRWQVDARPDGSRAAPSPADAERTSFTPDRQGRYQLTFTAEDIDGNTASCEVEVIGTPTGPDAVCQDYTTPPLETVVVEGDALDDGQITRWRWQLVGSPLGSSARPPSPSDGQQTRFEADVAGTYLLELTVEDDDGNTSNCTSRVEAIVQEGIRVEMFWDSNATDMDLHLLHPDANRWFNRLDCHWSNCSEANGSRLSWFESGREDDPRLDIDDVNGFGPENINIDTPAPGTYRVGVHAWAGSANAVGVRIFCGEADAEPEATFGPVSLRSGSSAREFWRVADITIDGAGRCSVRSLASADGSPNLSSRASADNTR